MQVEKDKTTFFVQYSFLIIYGLQN